jgi:N-acylglucosamine-6-phosphate 2-epimerase
MAAAGERAGAGGVRINRPDNIASVSNAVRIPIIGIYKRVRLGSDVYITRDVQAARAVRACGADIVALDATARRPRGYAAVAELIAQVRERLGCPVIADVASFEDGRHAEEAGADMIATTLFAYTAETRGATLPGLRLVSELARVVRIPVICEGGVKTPEQLRAALDSGAWAVVVGTALTGIEERVKEFVSGASATR